jgi:hypothetical protein
VGEVSVGREPELRGLKDLGVLKLLTVMVSGLQKVNALVADKIDNAVFLCQSP